MLSLFFIAIATVSFSVTEAKAERLLLEQVRPEIRAPIYTATERETMIEQSLLIFKEWNVNELVKHQEHSNRLENEALIQQIQAQGATLPIEELLQKISTLYISQFDDHLNFYFPKPIACYASEIPLRFNLAQETGPDRFLVSGIRNYRVLNLDGSEFPLPALAQIELGDELLSYNGMTTAQLKEDLQNQKILSRAHERLRLARNHMIWRNHALTSVPTENRLALKFRKNSGREYEVEIPWLVIKNFRCLQPAADHTEVQPPIWDLSMVPSSNELKILSDHVVTDVNVEYVMPVDDELGFGWGYYRKGAEKFGYFRLETFIPSVYIAASPVLDHHLLMLQFQRIFRTLNNDAEIKGLIIDVRDNVGGSSLLSASMIQSFTDTPVLSSRYRWKASASTAKFLDFAVNERGLEHSTLQQKAVQAAYLQGLPFSAPNTLWETDDVMAKQYGRVFFKPVTLITNSRCYSACENFAALMQDHAAARVIGEDVATGGGGANVWDHANVMRSYGPLPPELRFRPMPHGQNLRMPVRQTVRLGDPNKLIEDRGVISDEIVTVSREEIIRQSSRILDRASEYLASQNDGVHRPVPNEPHSILFDVLDGPRKLNLRNALVWDQSIFKDNFNITENEYVVNGPRPGEYSLGTHQRLIMGFARANQTVGKLRFRLNVKSEACCDRILVGVHTPEAGEKWLASYSGDVNEVKELDLALGTSERFELLITTSTDFRVSKGQFSISDVEIF